MEAGDLIVAIVKEFATEMKGNMAICCLDLKISMEGRNYHIEMKGYTTKKSETLILKDRDLVKYLILKKVELSSGQFPMELRHFKNSVDSFLFAKDVCDKRHDRQRCNATLDKFLKVLESNLSKN